jgi:uncharacterized protein (TIGR03435 family)
MVKTISVCFTYMFCFSLTAGDISGRWSGSLEMTAANGEFRSQPSYLTLRQDGNQLTGTAGPDVEHQNPISDGSVRGDVARFSFQGLTFELTLQENRLSGQTIPTPPFNRDLRDRMLQTLEDQVTRQYTFPDVADKMAAVLNDHASSGKYDSLQSPSTLASTLTEDLREVSHDRHIRVGYSAIPAKLSVERDAGTPPAEPDGRNRRDSRNFGFEKVERLAGNVGYVEFRIFADARQAGPVAAAAMGFVANTDALIIDIRQNGGGSPDMVELMCSYLFPAGRRVHLNDLAGRDPKNVTQHWTLPYLPGPNFGDRDIYVLTSRNTFSGAEEFAYNLQTQKRATIVGEVTGGGANPGGTVALPGGFNVFIPRGHAINPVTKTNWEGVGVKPEVEIAADLALKTTHLMALRKLAASHPLGSDGKKAMDDLEKELNPEVASVKPSQSGDRGLPSIRRVPDGRFTMTNGTLKLLISWAYGVADHQISGGPSWLNSERYDIVAKWEGDTSWAHVSQMVQTLLANRFQLRLHRETKQLAGYALVVGQNGPHLHEAEGTGQGTRIGKGRIAAQRVSMEHFAKQLERLLGVTVVDRTALKGDFAFKLEWTPDPSQPPGLLGPSPTPAEASGPSIFAALQEQLGLKLESATIPVEILVLDGAAKASEN